MKLHNKGRGSKYVRSFLPFNLVYLEKVLNKSDALKREIEIKKMSRKNKEFVLLHEKNLIVGDGKHGK
jgi:putative endonuclease